jgi:hypothetical protein
MPEILRIELRRGLLEPEADPGRLPVHLFVGARITGEITGAIAEEGILDLEGVYGQPEAGDPIQYDCLRIVLRDRVVEITVYNLALALFHSDDERMRRIHRALGALENSIVGSDESLPLPLIRAGQTPKIGRNEPCPCGSGKKYKKCCLDRESGSFGKGVAGEVLAEIRGELEDKGLESLEDAQAAAAEVMNRRNSAAVEDFSGLSPRQMHRIISFPFDSPDLARFAEDFSAPEKAPMMMLFTLLAEAVGKEGLRSTAKGNLPRKFCQDAMLKFNEADSGSRYSDYIRVNREEDFLELQYLRLVAVMAGFFRKRKGKFLLTVKGRKAAEDPTGRLAFFGLFRTCAEKFNWGFFDFLPDYHIIQGSFLYTLYLLHVHGDTYRPAEFYGELFLRAFPVSQDEGPAEAFFPPREKVIRCHGLRNFERFAVLFGLAEMREVKGDKYSTRFEVKKTPFLDDFIHFNLSSGAGH